MSTWADMFPSEPTSDTRATPAEPELVTPETLQSEKPDAVQYASNGPEPPPNVIRLRHPGHLSLDLIRVKRGWAWVPRDDETPPNRDFGGWPWERVDEMRPGLWAVMEEEAGASLMPIEPPPDVLRVALHKPSGEPVAREPDTYAFRCVEGGWHWTHDPTRLPDKGWQWGSSCMSDTARWTDHTTEEDRERNRVYRFSDPEPPEGVVRLRIIGPECYKTVATGEARHVARCRSGGWWVLKADAGEVPERGWAWSNKDSLPHRMVPVFPMLDPISERGREMVISLAKALPDNEEWYQIGTDEVSGMPVWASNYGDDIDFLVSGEPPG